MNLDKTLTSSVYVVHEGKVLLHIHKKYKKLFPLGGHMEVNELPHETAIREVLEESGLSIKLYNPDRKLELGRVIQLHKPMHILLENVGHVVENIDFIYFAIAVNDKLNPAIGESKEFYWFSKKDIENSDQINPHVKQMALDALNTIHV